LTRLVHSQLGKRTNLCVECVIFRGNLLAEIKALIYVSPHFKFKDREMMFLKFIQNNVNLEAEVRVGISYTF
jgi:hypothetical protein